LIVVGCESWLVGRGSVGGRHREMTVPSRLDLNSVSPRVRHTSLLYMRILLCSPFLSLGHVPVCSTQVESQLFFGRLVTTCATDYSGTYTSTSTRTRTYKYTSAFAFTFTFTYIREVCCDAPPFACRSPAPDTEWMWMSWCPCQLSICAIYGASSHMGK
jgi:hypothetical protein